MSTKTPVMPVVYKDEKHVVADSTDVLSTSLIPVSRTAGNLVEVKDGGVFADISISSGHGIAVQGEGTTDSPVTVAVQLHKGSKNLVQPEDEAGNDTGLLVMLNTSNTGDVHFSGSGTTADPLVANIKEGVVPDVLTDAANMLEVRDDNSLVVKLHKTPGKGVSLTGDGTEASPLVGEAVVAPGSREKPNALQLDADGLNVDRYKLRDFEQSTVIFMTPEVPKVVTPKMGTVGYENMREELLVLNGQNTIYTLDLSAITGVQKYNRHIRVILYAVTLSPISGNYTQGYSEIQFITKNGKIITPHGKVVTASNYKLRFLRSVTSVLDIYFGDQGRVMLTSSSALASDNIVYSGVHNGTDTSPGSINDAFKFTLDKLPLYGIGCAYAVDMRLDMMLLTPVAEGHSVISSYVKCYEGPTEIFNARNVSLNNINRTATFTHTYSAILVAQGDYGVLPQAYFDVDNPVTTGTDISFRYHATVSVRRIDPGYTNLLAEDAGYGLTVE